MDKHWAREAVETTGDLAKAKKLQENVRQSPEKEMKSISRSIEALERILPAISSCLLTWSNPDSPRKRQGNERQASRRRAEQVKRGGTSEISRAHSTDGQSPLQESTVGRPGSDWQTQPWSPLPFQAASAHISIAAATSILASPSAMVSMTPSKNEESRIVHLVRYQHSASALTKSSPSFLPPSLSLSTYFSLSPFLSMKFFLYTYRTYFAFNQSYVQRNVRRTHSEQQQVVQHSHIQAHPSCPGVGRSRRGLCSPARRKQVFRAI